MINKQYHSDDLKEALIVLRSGGVIVYPTDTVWGIGCDATNPQAVKRIYDLKQREDSKSMLVLLDSAAKLDYYVLHSQEESAKPLTIIYPHARNLAQNLIAQDGSVGIRITNETFSKELCARLKRPIVSTSANISGQPTARFFHEIDERILNGADYVCRFRRDDQTPHAPSSIIKVNADNSFIIIRQ